MPFGKSKNLADCVELDTSKFLLKVGHSNSLKHLFSKLAGEPEVLFTLYKIDVSNEEISSFLKNLQTDYSLNWLSLFSHAKLWAEKENRDYIDKLDLLLAITSNLEPFKKILFEKEIKEEDYLNIVFWARQSQKKEEVPLWKRPVESLGPGIETLWSGGWTLETERFTQDLTKLMQKGYLQPYLIDREKEIVQIEEVLSRDEKRNIILLGPPGIGKRSIVYGLADKSIRGLLPESLKYKRFLEIDVTTLLAGASGGELETRIQNLLTEVTHAGNIVLFIPEVENLAGSSGTGVNITGHLLTALSSDRIQVIATSTRESYRRYIEKEGAFSSLFEIIDIEEPSFDVNIRILEQITPRIEAKNKIAVTYKALSKTIQLANRYLADRVLPAKAIDLLEDAAAATALKSKWLLEPSDIEEVISQKTKVPVQAAKGEEARKLLRLEEILHQRIIDQNEAITAISNALRRARTIERETKKPIGSFLFLGPTGVGKTETAKALAALYFGDENKIIRVDMSEFQEISAINRLIGAPPGTGSLEEGGELTEKVRENPYSLILLDEMEKAHQTIQEAFLPVFDEGIMTDATGRKIVFTNTIIIATSNAGAEYIRESIQQGVDLTNLKNNLLEKLQREAIFKPEFLNRFDEIVVFKPLSETEVMEIVRLLIKGLAERLIKQDIYLNADQASLFWIAKTGFDVTFGARPLKRFIADNVEEKIAEKILSGEIKRGDQVSLTVENNQIVITPTKP